MTLNSLNGAREEAKELLRSFIPLAGSSYSANRNFDRGGQHKFVSRLSKYLSRRILLEEEVIQEVLSSHSVAASEKFIQEVIWRTYWKGWLEKRPQVWRSYKSSFHKIEYSEEELRLALLGQTGIDCFDHWVNELLESGYLHNHARMWFASIWIFTLKLPWQLGAKFFEDYLVDFDAASNTLSWRWVAGLQTKGKHYLARAENINKFTEGRFNPTGQLNEKAEALTEKLDLRAVDSGDINKSNSVSELPPKEKESVLLLVTEEDLGVHPLISPEKFSKTLILRKPTSSNLVRQFSTNCCEAKALEFRESQIISPDKLKEHLQAYDCKNLVMLRPHVGPIKDRITETLESSKASVSFVDRHWDIKHFPKASAGFFKFKKLYFNELLNPS